MTPLRCRVCGEAAVALHSRSENLPICIWPLPEGEDHEFQDAELHLCGRCGHLQLQDLSEEFMVRLYAHEAFNIEDEAENARRRECFERELGDDFFRDKRVLDIGGGRNSFAALLTGGERWISDFSVTDEVRAAATKTVEGDFLKAELPSDYFDIICLFHCLEHFNSPASVIEKTRELLREEGAVLVEVPNAPEVIGRMPYYAVFHQHVNLFSLETLDWIFGRHGMARKSLLRSDDVLLAGYVLSAAESGTAEKPSPGGRHADRLRRRLAKLGDALRKLPLGPDPKRIGLYGGGGSSGLFLANFPWLQDKIADCYDRDPRKHNRLLPGGRIKIFPPAHIREKNPGQIIFLSSSLCKEVTADTTAQGIDIEAVLGEIT